MLYSAIERSLVQPSYLSLLISSVKLPSHFEIVIETLLESSFGLSKSRFKQLRGGGVFVMFIKRGRARSLKSCLFFLQLFWWQHYLVVGALRLGMRGTINTPFLVPLTLGVDSVVYPTSVKSVMGLRGASNGAFAIVYLLPCRKEVGPEKSKGSPGPCQGGHLGS